MRKAKTYFEQVPLKVVEELLRLQAEQKKLHHGSQQPKEKNALDHAESNLAE